MIPIDEEKENKKNYILGIIMTVLVSLIIIIMVSIYYFVISDTVPEGIKKYLFSENIILDQNISPGAENKQALDAQKNKNIFITKVIRYVFPTILPEETKNGNCSVNSTAQPFRQDAWKCSVDELSYDPCFNNEQKDMVICQINPLDSNIFLIKLTDSLPSPKSLAFKNNWVWFLELEDGTICSPYTEKGPLINEAQALYGCKAKVKGDLDVLIGDLIVGEVWTAKRMIVTKDLAGTGWDTKSSEIVRVKAVWQ